MFRTPLNELLEARRLLAVDLLADFLPDVTADEGQPAANVGTWTTSPSGEPTITASIGYITVNSTTQKWEWSPADDLANQTVRIDATHDGGTDFVEFQATVNNVDPSLTVDTTAVVINEGTSASKSITTSDVPADTVTVTASIGVITDNGGGSWTWSYDGTDDLATTSVIITATDEDGGLSSASFDLTVNNVAPTVMPNPETVTVTIDEGETAVNTGTWSDPGDDFVFLGADYGSFTKNLDGTWNWSFSFDDGPDDSRTITVAAFDSDGGSNTTTFDVVVNNVAPSVASDNPTVEVNEGETATNTGSWSDPGDDIVTLSASAGTVIAGNDGTWSWSFLTTDGIEDSQTVTITASDAEGEPQTTTFELAVNNVAPSVASNNATVTANEGAIAMNSGTWSDPGADVVELSASVGAVTDTGHGTWSWALATSGETEGSQTVTITADDGESDPQSTTFELAVSNVSPSIAPNNATVTIDEGGTAMNSGTWSDPGGDAVVITASVGTITIVDDTWSWSLLTTDGIEDSQTVTITATDSDGAASTTTFALVVANVAPSVDSIHPTVTVNEGETAENTGTWSDPGADTVALTASVGTVIDTGEDTWSWSLPTTDGPDTQLVVITATDSDGAGQSFNFFLTVNNVAPAVVATEAEIMVDEGATATNSGTWSDAAEDAVTLSASVGTVTANVNGTWDWQHLTTNGTGEPQEVTITATDSDNTVNSTTFSLTVNNIAPTLTSDHETVTVAEGATATNTGTWGDAGGDELTLSATVGTVTLNDNNTWTWEFVTTDGTDDSQDVTITATDGNKSATTTFSLTVDNVGPILTSDQETITINESETATNMGTWMDPGDDFVFFSVSAGILATNPDGTWSWEFESSDGADDSQPVTISAIDSDGQVDTITFALVVLNVAPSVSTDEATVTVAEGETASNAGLFSDPGGDAVTFEASVGTVTQDQENGTWSWDLLTEDGPTESQTVTITATDVDDDALSTTTSFELVVNNLMPTVAASADTITVDEGQTAANIGTFSDPGSDAVTISASIGSITQDPQGSWSWEFLTAEGPEDSQTVTITATDSDNITNSTTFELVVKNAPPTVSSELETITFTEGDTATHTGTWSDVGTEAVTLTATVGTVTADDEGNWSWASPTTDGPFSQPVTITATDSDNATDTTTFTLEVENAAPTVTANNESVSADEGSTATNSGSSNDVGLDEVTLTASVGTVVAGEAGAWTWEVLTTDGLHESTVRITATDSDGAEQFTEFTLVVNNVAPNVTTDIETVTVEEGDSAANTGTWSDAGVDEVTLTASVGTVTANEDGTWSWGFTVSDGPDQSGLVTITATDSDDKSSSTAFALVVGNAKPAVVSDAESVEVNEGELATNTGTWSDAGLDTVTLTASVGTVVANEAGTWNWEFQTSDGPNDSQTVTITATDSDDATQSTTFGLAVANLDPTVASDVETVTVEEGATATATGTWSDPGTDVITLSASVGTVTAGENNTWSWEFATNDGTDDSQTVTITATDDEGATHSTTFALEVTNVTPEIALDHETVSVNEGDVAINAGSWSDPGDDFVGIGASDGTATTSQDGTWNWSFNTADGPEDSRTVTLAASDSDGASQATTFELVVNNLPPNLASDLEAVTVGEGETATNTGTWNDPGLDDVTLTASVGTIIANEDGTWSWAVETTDGADDSQTVTISATDTDDATQEITFELVVENVAPDVTADSEIVTVGESETATNTGTWSDVGADGVSLEASAGTVTSNIDGTWSWELATTDGPDDSQTITITATDIDEATQSITFELVVEDVAPEVTVDNLIVTVNESELASNTGSWSDVGADEVTLSASIGTVTANESGTWSWEFVTTDGLDESQTVTITAADSDDAAQTTTFDLVVENAAPVVASDNATITVAEGETATNTGTWSDVGADEVTLTASIGTVIANDDGTWAWEFTATDGPEDTQTVTLTATDSDNAAQSTTFDLVVGNLAPEVTSDNSAVTVGEGETATNSGTWSDAGADDVTLTASVGTVTTSDDGTWSWEFASADGPEDSQTVTLTATDSDDAAQSITFDLVVENVAPEMTSDHVTVTVAEGQTATNRGTWSDSGADAVTLSTSIGSITANDDGSWSWEFATTDGPDESQTVTVTATDSDDATQEATFELVVENVASDVTSDHETVTVNEGETATNAGVWSDVDTDDVTLTASIGTVTANDDGTWNWQFATTDGLDESQTVTITATDSDDAAQSTTFQLVVENLAPVVTVANDTVTVVEAVTAANSGTWSDAGVDDVTLTASLGLITASDDGTWSWEFATTDGTDESQLVTITGIDSDGAVHTTAFALIVNNAAPTLVIDNESLSVGEGELAANTGTWSDDGADDVSLTASAGTIAAHEDGTWSWEFPTTNGPVDSQTVIITAIDSDDAIKTISFELTVNNIAPEVASDNATISAVEGEFATNTGTWNDAGTDGVTLTASVGDVVANEDGTWSWEFTTSDGLDDSQTVTITATDGDGAAHSISFELVVDNVPPTVVLDNAAISVGEGEVASNSGTWSDVGADEVSLTASVGTVTANEDGTWNWEFQTADGPEDSQTVTITAMDSDNATTTASFELVVNNIHPDVSSDNEAVTVVEGETAVHTGTWSDVGDDIVTLTATVGTVIGNDDGSWSWEFAPTDGPDDSQAVIITATDSDDAAQSTTFELAVENVVPTVASDNDTVSVGEGETATNSGTWSDPGADDVILSASVGTITGNDDGTWSWEFTTTDGADDSQTVTITATDSDGATQSTTFEMLVDNLPPELVAANATVTVGESETAINTGTWSDAGADDVTLTASAGSVALNEDGTWSWEFATTDGTDQSQTVTVTAEDSDGAVQFTTFDLVVNNVAPLATVAQASVTVNESEIATNSGTWVDPGDDPVSQAATVGFITTHEDGTWHWSFDTTDGPAESQIVEIVTSDGDGAETIQTFEVLVNNLPPTIGADSVEISVVPGDPATNSGTWGDVGLDDVTLSASVGTVTQNDDGTWAWAMDSVMQSLNVSITATDSDGDSNVTTFDVTLHSLPTLSGSAYVDINDDGVFGELEQGILGVEIVLTGTDDLGNSISRRTFTDLDGFYQFPEMRPGEYRIQEIQPYEFLDGRETPGDGTTNDEFNVILGQVSDVDYNFGELGLLPEYTSSPRLLPTSSANPITWQSIDVRDAPVWYPLVATGPMFLDFSAVLSAGSAEINLFAADMNLKQPVDTVSPIRIQEPGQYYLQITGDTVIDSLTMKVSAPSITIDGNTVLAVATNRDDHVEVTLGETEHLLNISGLHYSFDASVVTSLRIGAGGGEDSIHVLGTELNESASVFEGNGTFVSHGIEVRSYTFDTTTFDGNGGIDYAQSFGSDGDDRFTAFPYDATLTTPTHIHHMLNFARVDGYGRGGVDYAQLFGSAQNDSYFGSDAFSSLDADGSRNVAKAFERVDAFGRAGNDRANVTDSAGNDFFYASHDLAYLSASGRLDYMKGFESVEVASIMGGSDVARFVADETSDNEFESRTDLAFMTNGTSFRQSTGFARNFAIASGTGFNRAWLLEIQAADTLFGRADLASINTSRVVSATGFDDVVAEALEGESPTTDVENIDYALGLVGDWI